MLDGLEGHAEASDLLKEGYVGAPLQANLNMKMLWHEWKGCSHATN
jgi:hypothetical protein